MMPSPKPLCRPLGFLAILTLEVAAQGVLAAAPAPSPDDYPDFPAALRRAEPVTNIRQAVVYTVNELIDSEYGLAAARKTGSDVAIRGWFKWNAAPDWSRLAPLVPKVHALGTLFGAGVTCSAIYDGENGLTQAQVLDMATRGPDGNLVDAWGHRGVRHGSLSSQAYREYVLSWCRKQIDAGTDYLFMDEINAALGPNEGFDDHSLRDFREYLVRTYCQGKTWARTDPRWRDEFKIDLKDATLCPDGTISSFDYRAYLKVHGLVAKPHGRENPLAAAWAAFRRERDDAAWVAMTTWIRNYAASKGRRVYISGNGLAPHVDLQVLGVWGLWRAKGNAVDLTESQVEYWSALVRNGRAMAQAEVPVVFFHDWGMNGFPWMEALPRERELWMRTRGAEVYAAGGFFAFPIHGPYGQDAVKDSTLREVARQAAFYQQNRDLYLNGRLLGLEPLTTDASLVSLALWSREKPPALLLHVINRQAEGGTPARRQNIAVRLPATEAPKAVRIVSPDFGGERAGQARVEGGSVLVTIPEMEAYAVAILEYDVLPAVRMNTPRLVTSDIWTRPPENEFAVDARGQVANAAALIGYVQGNLHHDLANPPTFLVNMPEGGLFRTRVRAVAMGGARLEIVIDGQIARTVDLPDLDRKNDARAAEYNRTIEVAVPPGRHRIGLRNTGGDWAYVESYSFTGRLEDWR